VFLFAVLQAKTIKSTTSRTTQFTFHTEEESVLYY